MEVFIFEASSDVINYPRHRDRTGQDLMTNDILYFSTRQTSKLSHTHFKFIIYIYSVEPNRVASLLSGYLKGQFNQITTKCTIFSNDISVHPDN